MTLSEYKEINKLSRLGKPIYFTAIGYKNLELGCAYTLDEGIRDLAAVFYKNILLPEILISDETWEEIGEKLNEREN